MLNIIYFIPLLSMHEISEKLSVNFTLYINFERLNTFVPRQLKPSNPLAHTLSKVNFIASCTHMHAGMSVIFSN